MLNLYKHSRKFIILSLFLFSLFSCQRSKLEKALAYSGENRSELEQVLTHFSANPSDSLKLKAAIFLIENMPGHYSFIDERTEPFFHAVHKDYPRLQNHIKMALFCLPQYYIEALDTPYEEDIKVIKADFLINHIERCVKNYEAVPWGHDLSFDIFCKYVLPYRADNEPLNEIIRHPYYIFMDSVLQGLKAFNLSSFQAASHLQKKLFMPSGSYRLLHPVYTSDFLDCLKDSYVELTKNRSMCIPMAFDYTPHWPNRNGRHYWNKVIHPFLKTDTVRISDVSKFAKVYRISYHHNEIPENDGVNHIPQLFKHPFNEDVTDEYAQTSDVTVNLKKINKDKPRYVYLSIFNEMEWKPVAWSKFKKKEATFHKIGRGNVYLPVYYVKDKATYADAPFLIDGIGRIKYFIPDKENLISLKLNRKYPMHRDKMGWSAVMGGVIIGASNDVSFMQHDTLTIIYAERYDSRYEIDMDSCKTYRYLRLGKPGSLNPVEIAELAVYDKDGNIIPVTSTNILQRGTTSIENLMFDGNPLTYIIARGYLYLDLGAEVSVGRICVMTRNDDNYIMPGESYELLYWDSGDWVSAGIKTANHHTITYDNIPSNALYWLRNLTKGREERIFSYENDTQIWL